MKRQRTLTAGQVVFFASVLTVAAGQSGENPAGDGGIGWNEINPVPAAVARAAVRVDASATETLAANLGTAGGTFEPVEGCAAPEKHAAALGVLPAFHMDATASGARSAMKLSGLTNPSRSFRFFMAMKDANRFEWKNYFTLMGDVIFKFSTVRDFNYANLAGQSINYNYPSGLIAGGTAAVLEHTIEPSDASNVRGVYTIHHADRSETSTVTASFLCPAALNHTELYLGNGGNNNNGTDYHLGEFLLFTGDNALTDAEAEEVAVYLRRKWAGMPTPVGGVVRVPADETAHLALSVLTCADAAHPAVFDVAEGATLFVDCPIADDGSVASSFVKRGAGTLVLTRPCPLTGTVTVEAGTVEVRGDGALPDAKIAGAWSLGADAAVSFGARSQPVPAAVARAAVRVDASATETLAANLGTGGGTFEPVEGCAVPDRDNDAFGTLAAFHFKANASGGNPAQNVMTLTGLRNASRSLRFFVVAKDVNRYAWRNYLTLGRTGENNVLKFSTAGDYNYINFAAITTSSCGNNLTAQNEAAVMEYKLSPASDSTVAGAYAIHYADRSAHMPSGHTFTWSTDLDHDQLFLGDGGGNRGGTDYHLGEFLLFTGANAITDDEAKEVVAYLRRKWLGAAAPVAGEDRDAGFTTVTVAADTAAALNGSAAPGLLKTGPGLLRVQGDVNALTVADGAVAFAAAAGTAPTVGTLSLADGTRIVYEGTPGRLGALVLSADTHITVEVACAVDSSVQELTVLDIADGMAVPAEWTVAPASAFRWRVSVTGTEVKLLKNTGTLILIH